MNPGRPERLYRLLLHLLPRAFRLEAEPELLEVFRAARRGAAARGRLARVRFWWRTTLDVVVTAVAERRPPRPSPVHGSKGTGMRLVRLASAIAADTRFGIRRLLATPAWTLVSSGTLALGLGASIVAGVLIRDVILDPLPFPDGDRLVRVLEISSNGRGWWPSYPNARDWRGQRQVFDAVGIVGTPRVQPVLLGTHAVRAETARAGTGLFEMLGVRPVAGRLFTGADQQRGAEPVAVVTEAFWRGALNGTAPGTAALSIGGTRYTVVGVLPASFRTLGAAAAWTTPADVWTPLERELVPLRRTSHGDYHVMARLRPGLSLDAARREANAMAATLKAAHGEPTQADELRLTPLHEVAVRSAREPLQFLLYGGLGVLFVAALNLAAAVLAQGLGRARELQIRRALGASAGRLVVHLVTGAATLALPGTLLGVILAVGGVHAIRVIGAGSWPRLDEVALDAPAVLAGFGLAAVTATLAGLVPALLLASRSSGERLRTRGTTSAGKEPLAWTALVAGQVALGLVLLAATGLLVRSFVEASRVDLGYDPRGVLAVDVTLPELSYTDTARRLTYYDEALRTIRQLPGVSAVGLTSVLPHETTAYTSGTRRDVPGAPSVMAGYRIVDPGYFDALRVPVRQGDLAAFAASGALVDQRLQELLWNGRSPIGDRVLNSFAPAALPVVGTVGNVREWNQGEDTVGVVYSDYRRHPERALAMHVVVRAAGDRVALATAVRGALLGIDPTVPVAIEPLDARVAEALGGRRLLLLIATGFGLAALCLAAAGVYAMIAFTVARRARESAIRLALGASPRAVGAHVLAQGLRPAAAGAAIGVLLTLPAGRLIQAQLFNVRPADPLVLATAAVAVLAAALAASAAPARRSSRVDPSAVLRQE